jgi:diguanylate cyclase (GGDEF)-like protein
MANVNLHYDVQRQAITDDLTGLATHGRFQECLGLRWEEVRRYWYPVGLIMLGHQQGDLVLRAVADALRETSRDVDVAARCGGEELALIVPADLDGAYEMAERARTAIQALKMPLLDGEGSLRVTASLGTASSADGDKNELIATADGRVLCRQARGQEPHREGRAADRQHGRWRVGFGAWVYLTTRYESTLI